ncbi:MAG: 3'-5' exonuclease [Eubacterium sp.]|nr:3'-5' exonuclease [Eubacterium sp.]
MNRFIVFDVETPNRRNNRMSAIGISVIEDGIIVDEYYSLVNPEASFDYFNTMLTGIDEDMVSDSPNFAELWDEIEPIMSSGMLVAHNAVFDLGVLKKCLADYGIDWRPYSRYLCTVQIGRRELPGISHKLNDMCDYYGIELIHHQAASDSHACAEILLNYMQSGIDLKNHIRTFKFR